MRKEKSTTDIKTFGLCGRYGNRLDLKNFFRFRKGFIALNVGQGIKKDLRKRGMLQ